MQRRAVILPVILFVLLLLGLFGAMFSFRVHSDVATVQAVANRLQTRLAAEAGVERMKMLLRESRFDRSVWYNNPDELHRVLVWAHDTDARQAGTNDELKEDMAYRFSIVADDPTEYEKYIRFGITDETSKLNLNAATADQLVRLMQQVLTSQGEGEDGVDPKAIADAIIDWRDTDSKPNGEAADTEGEYYLNLDKPYQVRNEPFTSVEELLLVKGVTGQVLYGEDFDRNGILTPNEDDGDESFPPDNQDGVLSQGMYPYVTVFSYENDAASGSKGRVYLFSDEAKLKKDLKPLLPDDQEKIDFIVAVTRSGKGTAGPGGNPGKTPGQNPDGSPAGPEQGGQNPEGVGGDPQVPGAGPGAPGQPPAPKPPRTGPQGPKQPKPIKKSSATGKLQAQLPPAQGGGGAQLPKIGEPQNPKNPKSGSPSTGNDLESGEGDEGGENPGGDGGSGDGGGGGAPIRSPAGLLRPRKIGPTEVPSPFTQADLPFLMENLTTDEPTADKKRKGLINVNTASRVVLKCLDGLTDEMIDAIIAARDVIDPEIAKSPAWLLTEGVIEDADAFDKVAGYLTGIGQQFTIESLGYADHIGMMTRLQVVVDMIGPIPQTVYYRDLSYLGSSFPIREEDKEQVRGR